MNKYPIVLTSLTFSDTRGNFIAREEYQGRMFRAQHFANMFMSERKHYYEKLYDISLIMAPIHQETINPEQIPEVFDLIEKYYGMAQGEIYEKTKKQEYVKARWFGMKICADRKLTEEQIGNAIGLNHSTVNHGKTSCQRLFMKNPEIQSEFDKVCDYVLFGINGRYNEDGSGEKWNESKQKYEKV